MSPLLTINKGVAIAWTYLLPVILKGHGTGRLHLPQDLNRRAPFDLSPAIRTYPSKYPRVSTAPALAHLRRHRLEHLGRRRPARITFHVLNPPLEFWLRDRRHLLKL